MTRVKVGDRVYYNGIAYVVVELLGKDEIRIKNLLTPKVVRKVNVGDVRKGS
jgi:tartrate dehydratase beta subunit/fumarate hydratase class I family protein